MTETTKILTVEDANRALDVVLADFRRGMKPAELRVRSARLADLYEIRAQLFRELLGRLNEIAVPTAVKDVATALESAVELDRRSMKFWRNEAGAR